MEEMMKAIFLGAIVASIASAALAQDRDAVALLTSELKSRTPPKWEVHVRWREDDLLLATITPWPYQEAFELWYDQPKLFEKLTSLCPRADDPVWAAMTPKQDIVIEPTVGGKTGAEARVNCRKLISEVR
jgi:hypothetical protein